MIPSTVSAMLTKAVDPLSREAEERRRKEKRAIALFELIDREKEKEAVKRRATLFEKIKKQHVKIGQVAEALEHTRIEREREVEQSRREYVKLRHQSLVAIHSPWIVVHQDKVDCQMQKGHRQKNTTESLVQNSLVDKELELSTHVEASGGRDTENTTSLKPQTNNKINSTRRNTSVCQSNLVPLLPKRLTRKRLSRGSDNSYLTENTEHVRAGEASSLDHGGSLASVNSAATFTRMDRLNSIRSTMRMSRGASVVSENYTTLTEFNSYSPPSMMNVVEEYQPNHKKLYRGRFYYEQAADIRETKAQLGRKTIPISKRYQLDTECMPYLLAGNNQSNVAPLAFDQQDNEGGMNASSKRVRLQEKLKNIEAKTITHPTFCVWDGSKKKRGHRYRLYHKRRNTTRTFSDNSAILSVFQTEESFLAFKARYVRQQTPKKNENVSVNNYSFFARGRFKHNMLKSFFRVKKLLIQYSNTRRRDAFVA
jgi:hypothetical protein